MKKTKQGPKSRIRGASKNGYGKNENAVSFFGRAKEDRRDAGKNREGIEKKARWKLEGRKPLKLKT